MCFPVVLVANPALLVPAPAAASQGKPQSGAVPVKESRAERPFTFKVPVNVVLVNVTVTNNAGKPVKDLRVDDFKVYEDGKRQKIQSFELESSQPVVTTESVGPANSQPGAQTPRSEGTRSRLISCFIDDLTERSPRYFGWVTSALQKFVTEEMGPQDQVGIFSASGGVRIPFTSNQKLLREQIDDLLPRNLNSSRPYRAMPDTIAIEIVEGLYKGQVPIFVQAKAERQFHQVQGVIHRLLASLRQHLRYLRHFKASKSLVLLSEGFVPARSMRWRVDRMVDQALQSRVTLNAVDISGLDMAGLSRETFFGDLPLEKLAENTGGIFYRDSNDLVAGLLKIRDARSSYYVLSYASPNQKANGKYHKIRVRVNRPHLELRFRRGYFAPREKLSSEELKNKDFQLALEAPGDFDQIPLQLAFRSSPTQHNRYSLSVLTNVGIEGMPFQQEGEQRQNLLHLVLMVFHQDGQRVKGSQKTIKLNLSNSNYRTMLQHGFTTETRMDVPAGVYNVKAVVRESHQTLMGSLHKTVTLPIPERDPTAPLPRREAPGHSLPAAGLESSQLVLSQKLTPLADLSAAPRASLLESRESLIFGDVQIHPLVNEQD